MGHTRTEQKEGKQGLLLPFQPTERREGKCCDASQSGTFSSFFLLPLFLTAFLEGCHSLAQAVHSSSSSSSAQRGLSSPLFPFFWAPPTNHQPPPFTCLRARSGHDTLVLLKLSKFSIVVLQFNWTDRFSIYGNFFFRWEGPNLAPQSF